MNKSPFQLFNNWLFDNNLDSKIPDKENLLKYNSPINHNYMISIFQKSATLNFFLNQYLNNIGLYYIDKEELMKFIKYCVTEFQVTRHHITYLGWPKRKTKLYEKLKNKFPLIKSYDISLLCDIIDNNESKDRIYSTFSVSIPKKKRTKKTELNVSLEQFLQNYSVVDY